MAKKNKNKGKAKKNKNKGKAKKNKNKGKAKKNKNKGKTPINRESTIGKKSAMYNQKIKDAWKQKGVKK